VQSDWCVQPGYTQYVITMSETHTHARSVYGRKKALCDACHEVLSWMVWYRNARAYELLVPVVSELQAEVLHIESSLTPEEIATAPSPRVYVAGVIYSYCLQASEIAHGTRDVPSVCEDTTAEHYMGRLYDRTSGALLWLM